MLKKMGKGTIIRANLNLYTEDGEVTPTMKVKRKSINAQFKDLIESMYRD